MTQCSAHAKSTGQRCRAPAMLGGKVCRVHGGKAPQVLRKAAERLALQEAIDRADRRPAFDVLADALHTADALCRWIRSGSVDTPAEVLDLVEANERAARLAKTVLDYGLDQQRAYVFAQVGRTYIALIERVMERLELTDDQAARLPAIITGELEELARDDRALAAGQAGRDHLTGDETP